ncbi:MAG: hypothetical protein PHF65_06320 [Oscillospiraceae bacterium]|nr:hypothetical protein [Oscillospiraceae bacterium]
MKRKSIIALLVALSICLSVIVPGCSLFDKSKDEISETVEEYLDDIKSGAFAQNDYRSDLVTDKPFSLMKFKDEGLRDCMKASLSMIDYKVKEANGNTSDKTGECLVSITHVDLDEVVQSFGKEWITVESLTNKLTAADAPKKTDDVLLFMEYDDIEKIWRVSASSEIAITLGRPYAEVNLYTKAGDPQNVLADLLVALRTGNAEEVKPFFANEKLVSEIIEDDVEDASLNEYFAQSSITPLGTEFGDASCTVEANVKHPDLEAVWAVVSQNVEVYCEMMKYQIAGQYLGADKVSIDAFETLLIDKFVQEMRKTDAVKSEETVSFDMKISEEGDRWIIKNVPEFLNPSEIGDPDVDEDIINAAMGAAILELYEEGVIPKKDRDANLKKYKMTKLKFSSRTVNSNLAYFEIFDIGTNKKADVFPSGQTLRIGLYFEFKREFPNLLTKTLVYEKDGMKPVMEYEIGINEDYPDSFSAVLLYGDGEIWPDGDYVIRVFGFDMIQIGNDLEFSVK